MPALREPTRPAILGDTPVVTTPHDSPPFARSNSLAVLLDVDGTLVDSVYLHAIAWQRAMIAHGVDVPTWWIHRHVGMGGDQLVEAVAGGEVEEQLGDRIREARTARFAELLPEVRPLPGAIDLLVALRETGMRISLTSSAESAELEHYRRLLGEDAKIDDATDAGDVERTKPDPELITTALRRIGGPPAVMVGDATWDCVAAARANVPSIGVATGGFARQELLASGAASVVRNLSELRALVLEVGDLAAARVHHADAESLNPSRADIAELAFTMSGA